MRNAQDDDRRRWREQRDTRMNRTKMEEKNEVDNTARKGQPLDENVNPTKLVADALLSNISYSYDFRIIQTVVYFLSLTYI